MTMRHSCVLFAGILCAFLSSVLGSYDAYGSTQHHDDYEHEPSYAAKPIVHPHHGHGHSAGSYYHYHVPLVGQQQQHYQPSHHDHSSYLWPLLLLLALPLLFLPLLPLLLLPLGISLLALLMPGGMMMMMMMMMMGMGMMPMMRNDVASGRALNEMRTFGEVVFSDVTSLFAKYARSLDLDQCPQRIACEVGSVFSPENNATDTGTAKAFTSFVMDQYVPKGKVKQTMKQYEKAFWSGYSGLQSCEAFQCQPTFRVYKDHTPHHQDSTKTPGMTDASSYFFQQLNASASQSQPYIQGAAQENKETFTNYVYPSSSNSKSNVSGNKDYYLKKVQSSSGDTQKVKIKRSHSSRYGTLSRPKSQQNNENPYANDKYFSSMLGTPTIKS